MELKQLLSELDDNVKTELVSTPEIVNADDVTISDLPIKARKWYRLDDVVAVVADLKDSTKLSVNKYSASTASIYEAATGSIAKIFERFDANYLQLQGDGGFALFWGEKCYERALCAAITIKTFSDEALTARLEKKWPSAPETGFKVGVASGATLVKRVGVPRKYDYQEPVWSGNAVNFAAKSAQCADRHQIVITGTVWDKIADNDYLTISCSCGTRSALWKDFEIKRIPEDNPERFGRRLDSSWCPNCGESYCTLILAGQTKRADADAAKTADRKEMMNNTLGWKAKQAREIKWGLALRNK